MHSAKEMRLIILGILILFARLAYGQRDTINLFYNGLTMIADTPFLNPKGDCIFCNPEIMQDRILLDSSKTMIARKKSNPLGFTYYEWRNKNHSKTFEQISFPSLEFQSIISYSDSGAISEQSTECSSPFQIFYLDDRWSTIGKIRIKLIAQKTDSITKLYALPKNLISPIYKLGSLRLFQEINFYRNGNVESSGTFILSQYEKYSNRKIGKWFYYNENGSFKANEIHTIENARE
jgi:hypothetical protein